MTDHNVEGILAVARCTQCGAVAVWPRHACDACGAIGNEIAFVDGGGHIHSVTVIHRPPDSTGVAIPYAVAIVSFDIGGKLMCRVPPQARIGDRVRAWRHAISQLPQVTVITAIS